MTKVTLLGDSIRAIGYGKMVPELLKDEFEKVAKPNGNLLPMADIIDELNEVGE